jgi:hypothetical protein
MYVCARDCVCFDQLKTPIIIILLILLLLLLLSFRLEVRQVCVLCMYICAYGEHCVGAENCENKLESRLSIFGLFREKNLS